MSPDPTTGAELTEPMKASWAMAHVAVQHRKELNAALRKMPRPEPGEIGVVPPRELVEEVGRIGKAIAYTADRALELLDVSGEQD